MMQLCNRGGWYVLNSGVVSLFCSSFFAEEIFLVFQKCLQVAALKASAPLIGAESDSLV